MSVRLSLDNISKTFGDGGEGRGLLALDGISLDVAPHEFLAIVGPSGCGKSTLLNIIAGFLHPTGGEIRIGGKAVTGHGMDRGVVFQDFAQLFPWRTALGNVEFGLEMKGVAKEERERIARKQLSEEWAAAREFNPDLIIYHPKAVAAPHIAEKLSCASVLASPLPGFTPTTAFASPLMPWRSLGPLNRLSHTVMAGSADTLFRGLIGEWRVSELELERRPSQPLRPRATLYAYSEHVLPVPADWPQNAHVCGQWIPPLATVFAPPDDLLAFLDAGEPPVYVGFGSMAGFDNVRLVDAVVGALGERRALFHAGWSGIEASRLPSSFHPVGHVPHDWLLPRCAMAIHHGGSGTTHSACRAGIPSVIVPFAGDQFFWNARLREAGVMRHALKGASITASVLRDAVAHADGAAAKRAAAALGRAMQDEEGLAMAVGLVERYAYAQR